MFAVMPIRRFDHGRSRFCRGLRSKVRGSVEVGRRLEGCALSLRGGGAIFEIVQGVAGRSAVGAESKGFLGFRRFRQWNRGGTAKFCMRCKGGGVEMSKLGY